MQLVNDPGKQAPPQLKCALCAQAMYATDWGSYEVTYHCSSAEARFWDFDRGTPDQAKAKEHWDRSRQEILVNRRLDETLHPTG